MSTLAVFLLLAGGGAIAASKLKRNVVKSKNIAPEAVKGVDADESTFGKVPSAASADTAGTATRVASNAVGAAGIQNPTRSVNLPLTSFIIVNTGPPDFNNIADSFPDYAYNPNHGLTIRFDDAAGTEDSASIESVFMIPPDYASGGSFEVQLNHPASTGNAERLNGHVAINGGVLSGSVFATLTTGSQVATVAPVPNTPYAPGRAVDLNLFVNAGAQPIDDDVFIQGVQFRYEATQ